jgi:hypothetical protein
MSEKNGDKARFQKNRKRGVARRAKLRTMMAGAAGAENAAAPKRRIKGEPRQA